MFQSCPAVKGGLKRGLWSKGSQVYLQQVSTKIQHNDFHAVSSVARSNMEDHQFLLSTWLFLPNFPHHSFCTKRDWWLKGTAGKHKSNTVKLEEPRFADTDQQLKWRNSSILSSSWWWVRIDSWVNYLQVCETRVLELRNRSHPWNTRQRSLSHTHSQLGGLLVLQWALLSDKGSVLVCRPLMFMLWLIREPAAEECKVNQVLKITKIKCHCSPKANLDPFEHLNTSPYK